VIFITFAGPSYPSRTDFRSVAHGNEVNAPRDNYV